MQEYFFLKTKEEIIPEVQYRFIKVLVNYNQKSLIILCAIHPNMIVSNKGYFNYLKYHLVEFFTIEEENSSSIPKNIKYLGGNECIYKGPAGDEKMSSDCFEFLSIEVCGKMMLIDWNMNDEDFKLFISRKEKEFL